MSRPTWPWAALLVSLLVYLLSGCQDDPPPPGTVDAATHFQALLGGTPVHLALLDCEVFLVGQDAPRERVLTTDFYPMPSVCMRQEISADADFVTVELGRQALGAGGCCATGGRWRSRDGVHWQRRVDDRWIDPHPAAEATVTPPPKTGETP